MGLFLLTALCKQESSTVGAGMKGRVWEGGDSGWQDHLGEAGAGGLGWLVRGKVRVGLLYSELGKEAPAEDFSSGQMGVRALKV